MTAPLLEVRSVGVTFGATRAVDDISLHVGAGEVLGIVGPNGAGKTTLLNGISRLVPVSAGAIALDGVDLLRLRADRLVGLGVARTFQAAEVFNDFKVEDYVMLGRFSEQRKSATAAALWLPHLHRSERRHRLAARESLARHGLEDSSGQLLRDLPYGQRKLVDVVRALSGAPRLLLLDEPTSGSALEDREALRVILGEARRTGTTLVLIDHDVSFVSAVCDRLLVMNFGRELGVGRPAEVLGRPEVRTAYTGLAD